jgi:hypothetical protein
VGSLCLRSYFVNIDGRRNLQAIVGLTLVIVLDDRLLEHIRGPSLLVSDRNIKGHDAHIATGYIVNVGVEEPENEAVVLDARLHGPGLPVAVKEVHGLRLARERIENDGENAVDLEELEASGEAAAVRQQLLNLVTI